MDFSFTEEQTLLRDNLRRIIADVSGWCLDRVKFSRGKVDYCTVCGRLIFKSEKRARVCYRTKASFTACMRCYKGIMEVAEG